MVQTLAGRDITEAFSICDTTTTGNCTLFNGVTSGNVDIASGSGRTGAINVGNSSSSGAINIDSGSSALSLLGSTVTIANTILAETATADANIANNITSGDLNVAQNVSRSGAINIGHGSSSGFININAGSSLINLAATAVVVPNTVTAVSATTLFNLANNSTTGGITSGSALTSGVTNISAGAARSGAINIGHATSSGSINIDAGTSALNLAGTNYSSGSWTPGMSDTTGNVANTTTPGGSATNRYVRFGNIVTCSISVSLSDKTGLTAGEVLRITGLPFAQAYASQGNPLHGPLLTGAGGNTYRLDHEASGTSCGMHKNDSVSVNGQILVSDVAASGLLKGTFTYFV